MCAMKLPAARGRHRTVTHTPQRDSRGQGADTHTRHGTPPHPVSAPRSHLSPRFAHALRGPVTLLSEPLLFPECTFGITPCPNGDPRSGSSSEALAPRLRCPLHRGSEAARARGVTVSYRVVRAPTMGGGSNSKRNFADFGANVRNCASAANFFIGEANARNPP